MSSKSKIFNFAFSIFERKEVKNMLRVMIMITAVVLIMSGGELFARGTAAGTQFSNLSVQAAYTSVGGAKYSNYAGSMQKVTVRTGYDQAVISSGITKQFGSAGQWLTFNLSSVTNYGNMSSEFWIIATTNYWGGGYTGSGWNPMPFEILTNGAVASSGNNAMMFKRNIAAGGYCSISMRVRILPGVTPDGSTNIIMLGVCDSSNFALTGPGSGDGWPTAYASYWGITPDLANARDYQLFTKTIAIQGPVLTVSKTVSTNRQLPFGALSYVIKYTNSGSGSAMGVRIVDVIPQNIVTIISNSAENFNTYHAGGATIEYWAAAAWQNNVYDNVFSQCTNISQIRWSLNTPVASGQAGYLRFSVIIK